MINTAIFHKKKIGFFNFDFMETYTIIAVGLHMTRQYFAIL